jgi:Coenzyme PQQ synthesis protein D (PqqD)
MSDQSLGLNSTRVAYEDVEGEIIAINYSTGAYFNLSGTAAETWRLLLAGHSRDSLASAYAQHADDPVAVRAQVESFIASLVEAELLVPLQTEPLDEPPAVGAFLAPVLEKFEDMAKLIQLDPIHEVSDRGWPYADPNA